MNKHWTESSLENFRYRITSDFLEQLIKKMKTEKISQAKLAKRLSLSAGRISQILNGEMSNFSLESVISYARALEMKVSLVAYEDGDPNNTGGPIDSEIFNICWERQGKPIDFFDLQEKAISYEDHPEYFEIGTNASIVSAHGNAGGTNALVNPELQQTQRHLRRVA